VVAKLYRGGGEKGTPPSFGVKSFLSSGDKEGDGGKKKVVLQGSYL